MSELGRAVKNPLTRYGHENCTYVDLHSILYTNEQMRSTTGTYIDFVGIDTYRHHFQTEDSFAESTRTNVPYMGKNFRMIMEIGARVPNIAQLHLAALSGNNAFVIMNCAARTTWEFLYRMRKTVSHLVVSIWKM